MKIFSQWRYCDGMWSFVPLSIWANRDFYGFTLLNFCFEWARTDRARQLHGVINA